MNEKDIHRAKELLRNKRQINALIAKQESAPKVTDIDIVVYGSEVTVRASVLKELLDKELNYTNRMLKSLGTTEIT